MGAPILHFDATRSGIHALALAIEPSYTQRIFKFGAGLYAAIPATAAYARRKQHASSGIHGSEDDPQGLEGHKSDLPPCHEASQVLRVITFGRLA
jgi:hypothetical protein